MCGAGRPAYTGASQALSARREAYEDLPERAPPMTRVMFAMYLLCSEACCRPEGDNSGGIDTSSTFGRGGGGGRPRSRDFSPEMRWLAPAHAIGWRLAIVIVLNAFALTLPLTAVDLYVVRA